MKVAIFCPDIYPYGAMLMGGILKEKGYEVALFKGLDPARSVGYDVVGLSLTSTLHLLDAKSFVSRVRLGWDPFMVVGGPVSQVPELVFRCLPEVDAVVVGEGEETTPELLQAHTDHTPLETIPGLALKGGGGEIITTPPRPHVSLEGRPLPLIPPDLPQQNLRGVSTCIETHRGCTGACTFCQTPQLFGHTIRSRPQQEILREVKEFVARGVSQLAMGLGTVNQYGWGGIDQNGKAFAQLLREASPIVGASNLKVPDLRADIIDVETLRAIKTYTAGYVVLGIESGSQRILSLMRKGITPDTVRKAVALARGEGLKVIGSFIVGYPDESEEDYLRTKELAEDLALDDFHVNIASPIPGTPLAYEVKKLPPEENPVFAKDEGKLGKLHGLTVAEARALDLSLAAVAALPASPPLTQPFYNKLLSDIQAQSRITVLFTNIIRRYL